MELLPSKYKFPTGKGKFQRRLHVSGSCLLSPSVPSHSSLKALVTNCESSNFVLKTDSCKGAQETAQDFCWKWMRCHVLCLSFPSSTHKFSYSGFKCTKVQLTTNLLILTDEYGKQWDSGHTLVLI